MTYSFESPKVFDKLLIPEDSELRKAITISNPLGEDFSIMRTLPLNGMLVSLSTNYNPPQLKRCVCMSWQMYTVPRHFL